MLLIWKQRLKKVSWLVQGDSPASPLNATLFPLCVCQRGLLLVALDLIMRQKSYWALLCPWGGQLRGPR